jgi:hypothetical protein
VPRLPPGITTGLLLLTLTTWNSESEAATLAFRTDPELVARSERVVHARITSVRAERVPARGLVETVVTAAVIEDLTGVPGDVLTFRELGGVAQGHGVWVAGAADYRAGQELLLCLESGPRGLRTVALGYSAFRIATGSRVERLTTDTARAAPDSARSVDDFRRLVAQVKGVTASSRPTAAASSPQAVAQPFTLLGGGIRWRQADDGRPVLWYRNGDHPSPLTGADTDAQIAIALAAWTRPGDARLVLQYGGLRSDGGAASQGFYCGGANAGVGLISFDDPFNEIPSGVLAIGGGCFGQTDHSVNGHSYAGFTHGFVVFNEIAAPFTSAPDFTRVLTHEIGHGIGLGHPCEGTGCTSSLTSNLMFPACCYAATPTPPSIGPDDAVGLRFVYPYDIGTPPPPPTNCVQTLDRTFAHVVSGGFTVDIQVTAPSPACQWSVVSGVPWVYPTPSSTGSGSRRVTLRVEPNLFDDFRSTTLTIAGQPFFLWQGSSLLTDQDHDGLNDAWEIHFRLDFLSATGEHGANGDPDGDGVTNVQEFQARTHPRGRSIKYLAEGVANAFFQTKIALMEGWPPVGDTAWVRLQPTGRPEVSTLVVMDAGSRYALDNDVLAHLTGGAPFSATIESERPLAVDRTVRWGAGGYGAHAETAQSGPSTTWYLAEGSTSGDFALFYLLQNPGNATVTAHVRYLRPSPHPPLTRAYTLPPRSRTTIPVDDVAPELASTDVSAVITADAPIAVERSMYMSTPDTPFAAGHASAGVTAPALEWFLAEGATGSFFDLFLLLANPNDSAAACAVDYLLPTGEVVSKDYTVAPNSRFTIYVDDERFPAGSGDRRLSDVSVAMRVRSTNQAPVIAERAMWWGGPPWYEAHGAAGVTQTGTVWAVADGEDGGPQEAATYILIANTSPFAGVADVMVIPADDVPFDDPLRTVRVFTTGLPPNSRQSIPIGIAYPQARGKRFGVIVRAFGAPAPQIVVERAMYWNVGGVLWGAGTAAVGTRLAP